MRARLFAPLIAVALALAACDDADPAASASPPQPAPPEQIEAATDAPQETGAPQETNAPQELASGAAGAEPRPAAPVPSSVFEQGAEALGEIDPGGSEVFADAPFEPGAFEAGEMKLTLDEAGAFTLEIPADAVRYAGEARVYGDMMTLSNVDAAPGEGGFPMTCRIAPRPPGGFALLADGSSCALLDGAEFTPAG